MIHLLEISAKAAILILVIIIIRALFIYKLPKRTFVILWSIVVLRLIIPFSLPVLPNFNLQVNGIYPEKIFEEIEKNISFSNSDNINDTDIDDNWLSQNEESVKTNNFNKLPSIVVAVWVLGAVISFGYFVLIHNLCKRKYLTSLPVNIPMEDVPIRRKVTVKVSDRINAPLTYGIIKPVIIIPKSLNLADKEQLDFIIAHEVTHIKHFDVLYKWIMTASVCIHWFNPLAWIMFVLCNRDIELACDNDVVKQFGKKRAEYALTLLSLEESFSGSPLLNGFSRNAVAERIEAIMKLKRVSVLSTAIAVILIMSTSIFFTAFKDSDKIANTSELTIDNLNAYLEETDMTQEEFIKLSDEYYVNQMNQVKLNYQQMLEMTDEEIILEAEKYGVNYSDSFISHDELAYKIFEKNVYNKFFEMYGLPQQQVLEELSIAQLDVDDLVNSNLSSLLYEIYKSQIKISSPELSDDEIENIWEKILKLEEEMMTYV